MSPTVKIIECRNLMFMVNTCSDLGASAGADRREWLGTGPEGVADHEFGGVLA